MFRQSKDSLLVRPRYHLIITVVTVILVFGASLVAQKPADPPKFSDAQKLKIREVQIKVQSTQLEIDGLLQAWPEYQHFLQLQRKRQVDSELLDSTVRTALADLKISEKDYDINSSLDLIPKPKPSPTPTPTSNK